MSQQRDRDEFIAKITAEGVSVDDARRLMRQAATLHRIAELQCSSEAADRDRVKCPGDYKDQPSGCLCRDYGSHQGSETHGDIPRIALQAYRIKRRVEALCASYGVKPVFQGDPRGAVVKLRVPSGKTDDWGATGLCVPA